MSDEYTGDFEMMGYCEDCRILQDALRDMEQQRREAEDEHFRSATFFSGIPKGASFFDDEVYLAKLEKLRRRRDAALEVLLKQQMLEHQAR